MIGSKVFFLNINKKGDELTEIKVDEATFCGMDISTNGYDMSRLMLDSGITKMVENAHVFEELDEANTHYERVEPLIRKGEEIANKAKKEIDELRVEIIGEPKFLHIAQQIQKA